MKRSRKKVDSVNVAASWLEMGILPVPLKPNSKKPQGGKGWNTYRARKETLPEFFKTGYNVGGLWGEPSGWIVDIDLDWDEACDLAPYLLPETFIYGRQSRPLSHYLYRCRGVSTSKRVLHQQGQQDEMIVELRSTGSQSVLPPSYHDEDPERYEINHDVPFKEIPRAELERLVDQLAAGALLVRNYPGKGSQHDFIHTVTGALLWSGWPDERVRKFINALLSVVDDRELDQRRRTVENTIDHFKKGNRIAGWNTLTEWITGRELQALKKWLVPARKYEQPPPNLDKKSQKSTIPPFLPDFLAVPGLVGELVDWSKEQSFLRQPSFDLATALMCTAIASSNKYIVQGWNTPLQPYFLLLAPTSAGKGASLKTIYSFAKRIGLHDCVFQGFQSYYALLDKLSELPNMACWLWDEAARHLAAAKSTSSPDYTTLSHIISLYGRANDEVPALPGRRTAIPALERPFLTLFATAQPKSLVESLSISQITTGFVNRIMLFDAGDDVPDVHFEREEIFPSRLKQAALRLKNHEPGRGLTTPVKYDGATYAHLREFDTYAREMAGRGEEHEIWGRANQNALILAGLAAVGLSPNRPEITLGIAQWATQLVQWSITCWLNRIGSIASRSVREGRSKRIEGYIRQALVLSHRGRSQRYTALMQKGHMPRAVLQRLCRDINSKELDDILDQLIEGDLIGVTEDDKGLITFWPKN